MNWFKWISGKDHQQPENVPTGTNDKPLSVMMSSIQLPSSTCPSSSSIMPIISADLTHSADAVHPIETIITTGSSINPYSYNRRDSITQKSTQSVREFAKDKRKWEKVRKLDTKSANIGGISFVVMSYNILAQTLLEDHLYLYKDSPRDYLDWDKRWNRLKSEIVQQNPDIICLQEVETSYLDAIGGFLSSLEYKGIFKQKTGIKVDGCAIFFKSKLFNITDYLSVEYMQPGVLLLNRDNVGMMVKLSLKSDSNVQFVVCTTHLLYNPRRTDVRLAQIQLLLAEIDRFSFQMDVNNSKVDHLPIIMTGDLNSFPNTPVTDLIDRGNINIEINYPNLYDIAITNACQHLEIYLTRLKNTTLPNAASSMLYHSEVQKDSKKPLIERKYSFEEYRHLFQNNFLRHHINFTSVYEHVKPDGLREATTMYSSGWVTVDYIYFSSSLFGRLEVVERYRLPTEEECNEIGRIPNALYGSDHFSLAAKFILTPVNTNKAGKTL